MSSGDGTILFRINSDVSKLVRDFNKLEAANEKLRQKMAKISEESRNQDNASKRTTDAMTENVRRTVTAYAGLHEAISRVNQALREQTQIDQAAARRGVELSAAQRNFQRAFGEMGQTEQGQQQVNRLMQEVTQLGVSRGFTPTRSVQAAGQIVQATSGAIDTRGALLRLMFERYAGEFTNTPEQFPDFAAGMADLLRAAGNPRGQEAANLMDPMFAMVAQALSQGRMVDLTYMKNLSQGAVGVAAATPGGDRVRNIQGALATMAAVSSMGGDPTNEMTRTATTKLAAVMEEFFVTENQGGLAGRFRNLAFDERLRELQRIDPRISRAFAEEVQGRSFMKPMLQRLGREQEGDLFREIVQAFDLVDPRRFDVDLFMSERGLTGTQRMNRAENRLQAQMELRQQRREPFGRIYNRLFDPETGVMRETATFAQKAFGGITGQAARFELLREQGLSPEETFERFLETVANQRRMVESYGLGGFGGPIGQYGAAFRQLITGKERDDIAEIRRLMQDTVDQAQAAYEENNANVQSQMNSTQPMNNREGRQ